MALDSGVKTSDSLPAGLGTAIERALTLEGWLSRSRDGTVSDAFVRRRTQFDSVAAFCAACPCDGDTIGAVQRLAADDRDEFVDRTTEFETWPEMRRSAATADLVTLQNV